MDSQATMSVSVGVVGLVQLSKWSGLPDRYGPFAVLLFSMFGVLLWGYSEGQYERTQTFEYFMGWLNTAMAAAGIYGFTRASGDALAKMSAPPGGAGSSPTIKS